MTEKFSLSELQKIIRDSLYLALPDFYWVIAEISEIKQNFSGHCFLELIEKQENETNVKARIRAMIWNNRYGFISSFFENTTGENLKEGLKVLIKTRIEYHELYGLSLIITDIDPSYTMGEMAAKRLRIIKELEKDGVLDMNKGLAIPQVPQRIAVISSASAAGYTDFMNHLRENSCRYVFYTSLFDAVMQGIDTESSITDALDRIALVSDHFDLVVIIRGGGSQSDLSWFDNYNIAYYVTQFPLPVITGIGHEKDLSVTDMVACRSLKTPTAVADFLVECISETENHILEVISEIKTISLQIIAENKERTERAKNTLAPLTKFLISDIRKSLSELSLEILRLGKERIYRAGIMTANRQLMLATASSAFTRGIGETVDRLKVVLVSGTTGYLKVNEARLSAIASSLNNLDPVNVLRRGYTITTLNGRAVSSVKDVSEDQIIDTHLRDGRISSRVTAKKDKT